MAQDVPQLPTFSTLGSETDSAEEQLHRLLDAIEDETVPDPAAFARDPAAGSLGRAAPSAKSELTLPLALGCRGSGPEAELQ